MDRIGAGLHRRYGDGCRDRERFERLPGRTFQAEYRPPLRLEALQATALMFDALLLQKIEFGIFVQGSRPLPHRRAKLEGRQMLARQVPDKIGRADEYLVIEDLHVTVGFGLKTSR
jgi:hypothetical protein